ncbi:MAG: hypothetical protein M0Q13_02870 [Methanothrix sp.]|nr:hypothetical protein [Methanothrix sp.]
MRQKARALARESKALESIEGAAHLAGKRHAEAARLQEQSRELQEQARLEDLTVWADSIVKQTKKGEKKYERWLAGWREGNMIRKVYLGSCKKMSQEEALQKARKMKAKALEARSTD